MNTIKVLIVDDHELLREGIKASLQKVPNIEVIGEVGSGEQALDIARKTDTDVILMDAKMPGIGGLEATRRILRSNPNIKIIALTSCSEEPFPTRFLQAGAHGYLTKGCSMEEIEHAIQKVYKGECYISPSIAQLLALKSTSPGQASPLDGLSDRELQIMLMITSGQKVQDISNKLCLSSKTVNSYRYRLFEKLNINNDVELTHLAIRYGIISKDVFPDQEAE